jgi:hypothetical protein
MSALRDKETLHRKVQELVDCFATTDPLKEMSALKYEEGQEESPLKWLALAVLHGINGGAKEISVVKSADGQVKVLADYYTAELPSPGSVIGGKVVESLRRITHLEGDKGETTLAVGIREASVDLRVGIIKDRDGEKVTLKFPGMMGQEKAKGTTEKPEKDLSFCTTAAAPEHERAYHEDEACDDARAGDYEKK